MENQDILSLSVRQFIQETAAKTPTPGGGSVAGIVGALGVALGEMAVGFTRGKKSFLPYEPVYEQVAHRLQRARSMFLDLVADDVAAFRLYQEASRRDDSPEKEQAVQLAVAAAIDVPRKMATLAISVLNDLVILSDKCSKYLASDLTAGATLCAAICRLCDYNVRINIPQVLDTQAAKDIQTASAGDVTRSERLRNQVEQTATF